MELLILVSSTARGSSYLSFKFQYGATNIKGETVDISDFDKFKFQYGATNMIF